MSIPLYAGIGAGVGAICGGVAGYVFNKKSTTGAKKTTPITAKASSPKGSSSPKEATDPKEAATSPKEAKSIKQSTPQTEELFGVKVTYLLSSNEFYTMLVRFENYLQFATERDSLKSAVQDMDNFLGMETLLHGRDPISKAAIPALAELARRKVIDVLNNIVEFSNEQRPSSTKKEAMNGIKNEINDNMLAIVKDMNRALAALPAVITTKTK